jgi:L-lactate dehydrogenase complex protein LldG
VAAPVSARDEVLARVRAATGGAHPPAAVAREYRRAGTLDRDALVELFCARVGEYRAEVRVVEDVGAAVAELCAGRRIAVPPGLPEPWRPDGAIVDGGLGPHELDGLDGVVTGCTVAIAETGTIVLTAAPHEGRRALTLVPDLHICVVEDARIVELVPEAIERLAGHWATRPITLVSGPSATSDIELNRVEGVHGPRTLVVLVAR